MAAGRAGRYHRDMKIREAMEADVEVVDRGATLYEAAYIMRAAGVRSLPVVEDERVVGLITDRDIIERAVAEGLDAGEVFVREVMSHEVALCREDDDLGAAERLMRERGIERLFVVDGDGCIAGIVARPEAEPAVH